jgi:hypothetical protein
VINGSFPDAQHSPYKISETDANGFLNELQKLGFDKAASAASEAVQKMVTKSTKWQFRKATDCSSVFPLTFFVLFNDKINRRT